MFSVVFWILCSWLPCLLADWQVSCSRYVVQLQQNGIAILLSAHLWLEMHDEIFHFEIFENFEIFQYPFLKYFMKLLIFNTKWLKTFKNMIKVYQVSRRYIMLFMHNNKYLPLTGLLTLLQWTIRNTACIVLHPAKYFDIYGVKWLKQANQASRPAYRLREVKELQYA